MCIIKRLLILVIPLIACLAFLCACSSGDDAAQTTGTLESDAAADEGAQPSPGNDLCEPAEGRELPDFCNDDKGSGSNRAGSGKTLAGEETPDGPVYDKVRFKKPAGGSSIDDGVLNADYAYEFEAKGGGGNYKWEMTGGELPPGLALSGADDGDSKIKLTGKPQAVGDIEFKLKVSDLSVDEATAETSSERTFKFTITENFTLNVFKKTGTGEDGDASQWEKIPSRGVIEDKVSFDPIELAPRQIMKIEVVSSSQGDKKWTIGGAEVDCPDGENGEEDAANYWCGAETETLEILVVNRNFRTTAYLRPKAGFAADTLASDIEITVKDEYGEGNLTIKSVAFQADPCLDKPTIDANNEIIVNTSEPEFTSNGFNINGADDAYAVTISSAEFTPEGWIKDVNLTQRQDGADKIVTIAGKVDLEAIRLKDMTTPSGTISVEVVKNGCSDSAVVKHMFKVTANTKTVVTVEEIETTVYFSADQTDGKSRFGAVLTDTDDNTLAGWGRGQDISLDRYGDEDDSGCDIDSDDTFCKFKKKKSMNIIGDSIDISKASFVKFRLFDPGDDSLYVMFYQFNVEAGNWCGEAMGMPREYECASDDAQGCAKKFRMTWHLKGSDGQCHFNKPTKKDSARGRIAKSHDSWGVSICVVVCYNYDSRTGSSWGVGIGGGYNSGAPAGSQYSTSGGASGHMGNSRAPRAHPAEPQKMPSGPEPPPPMLRPAPDSNGLLGA